MSTVQTMPDMVDKLDEAFDIHNAFIWEGSARVYHEETTDKTIRLSVHGTSLCDHDGDLDGIHNQVYHLNGKSKVIENITCMIISAKVTEEIKGNRGDDGEFNVSIKGEVIIKIA